MSSLENRGNGSWRLTISDGYAPDGKKIRFQRTIHVDPMHTPAVQRREAEKQAALLEADFRRKLPLTLYGLRHTAASLMFAEGLPIRDVAARLGHSQTSTTLDIYAHALIDSNSRATDAISRALEEARKA